MAGGGAHIFEEQQHGSVGSADVLVQQSFCVWQAARRSGSPCAVAHAALFRMCGTRMHVLVQGAATQKHGLV
jgi:hypothetical protein